MLRTKKIKIILTITVLAIILILLFVYKNFIENNKYEEQTVMAKNYLMEGSFTQAVEAYQKALSMKNSEQELLSIGLAEAYIGSGDYDKALEVLRSCYQNTAGVTIMEKIEEVSLRKTDYEYLDKISRANKYFSNLEYDKAIIEYEKAKVIKSKEVVPYGQITESYIAKGDYLAAKEEVLEGLAVVQSKELDNLLIKVDSYMKSMKYEEIITVAAEYIYQENYEDAIKKYLLAISLKPDIESAYIELAKTYLTLEKYEEAMLLLQSAVKRINSAALDELYEEASLLKQEEDESQRILSEMYQAMVEFDINKTKELMNLSFFQEKIAIKSPIYYGVVGEENISEGYGMIIYDGASVYCGNIKNGMKDGAGVYLVITDPDADMGYYYYQGKWSNDKPNGLGKTEEETTQIDDAGGKHSYLVVTNGGFINGYESGTLHKHIYSDRKEIGSVTYIAQMGIPIPLLDESGQQMWDDQKIEYIIGWMYLNEEKTDEYYSVKPTPLWGVKPFLKKK